MIIKSGGTGKKKLSINATKPNSGFENLCLASSTHYGFSPSDTFIIWILMAILINQSVTWKK